MEEPVVFNELLLRSLNVLKFDIEGKAAAAAAEAVTPEAAGIAGPDAKANMK